MWIETESGAIVNTDLTLAITPECIDEAQDQYELQAVFQLSPDGNRSAWCVGKGTLKQCDKALRIIKQYLLDGNTFLRYDQMTGA